jgi:filamentous hemagglutinin family protein
MGLALAAAPFAAQAQTTITPDAGARGLGTTASLAGHVTTIDGGTLAGGNLFHSFAAFSLAAGDTARWTRSGGDAGAVKTVVNRVTGGQPSQIGGTLDSTGLPNAAFYFINPAGIVFGPGAQVDVPAAAYFSTASQLRFADGTTFSVATPGGSTLSVAAPQAFGFVGGEGGIAVQGAGFGFASPSEAVALVGADVAVSGSQLYVRGLDLVATGAGAATVRVDDPLATPLAGALTVQGSQLLVSTANGGRGALRLGGATITLDGASLASDSPNAVAGGDIAIAGGDVTLRNGVVLGAAARGAGAGGALVIAARTLQVDGGVLYTVTTGSAAAGPLTVTADTMSFSGRASVSSSASGSGAAGLLSLTARASISGDNTYFTTSTLGSGAGGGVSLSAPQIDLVDALAVSTGSAEARPGDVHISGDRIAVSGGVLGSIPGVVGDTGDLFIDATTRFEAEGVSMSAINYSEGSAGIIAITAPQIAITGGLIDTSTFGAGGVGRISLVGQTLTLTDAGISAEAQGQFNANDQVGAIELKGAKSVSLSGGFVSSNAYSLARGGAIAIEGGKVELLFPNISADSRGSGAGGSVTIRGDSVHISNGSVTSDAAADGPAGGVTIQAPSIVLDQAAAVGSDALDAGPAGVVKLVGGTIRLLDGAAVTSAGLGGTGDAGAVIISGDSLFLRDSSIFTDTQTSGHAGAVSVSVGSLELDGLRRPRQATFISSDTLGDGDAGDVTIQADKIDLHDGGYVSSNAFGDGDAGRVTIKAGSFKLRGGSFVASDSNSEGRAGDVAITASTLTMDSEDADAPTFISSDSLADGDAGDVTVTAKALTLDNGAFISSNTSTFGEAGDVTINGGAVVLDHGAAVASAALSGLGNAGVVNITADSLKVGADATVTTSTGGAGDAGSVTLKVGSLTVDGGDVSSAAVFSATGASGSLSITAGSVAVTGGARISTLSNNPNPAGLIQLTADTVSVTGAGSAIASENQAGNPKFTPRPGAGDAGSVQLSTHALTVADGGSISTNSYAGAAGDIQIDMPRTGILKLQGATAPGVIQTSSGPGTGGRITISSPLAIVSNGGSLLALGQLRGANAVIQSRYFINSTDRLNTVSVDGELLLQTGVYDVSSGTTTRELSVLDASKVLRGQCPSARAAGVVSQLVSRPVGPYVREAAPAATAAPSVRMCR